MRARLDRWIDRAWPGLDWTAVWLTAAASWLLVLYHYHGGRKDMPAWFQSASTWAWGIDNRLFHGHGWSHTTAVVLLMAIPLALSYVLEGWKPADLGLRLRGTRREWILVIVLWVLFIPVIALVSQTASFQATYPRLAEVETDAGLYVAYQAWYLVKWSAWEFFFRGFLLFGLYRVMGNKAVLASTLPFVVVHFGKPELESASAVLAGFILCWIALRSKSIWPGVFIHAMVASTMDFFASSWWRG